MRIIEYTIKIIILAIILMITMSIDVYATTGKVNTDTLKIRKEPSTSAITLGLISIGQDVKIIETEDDWYKVKVDNITGYVSKQYITVKNSTTSNESENQLKDNNSNSSEIDNNSNNGLTSNESNNNIIDANNDTQKDTSIINTEMHCIENINMYILPLINSDKISNLDKNTKCKVISVAGEWSYVETSGNKGWIYLSKLASAENNAQNEINNNAGSANNQTILSEKNNTGTTNTKYQEKTAYIKSTSVNLRNEANTSSKILATLAQNTQIKIVGEQDDWYKVTSDGKIGYILKSLVSDKKVETTSRSSETDRVSKTTDTEKEVTKNTQALGSSVTGNDIVVYAKQYLGYRYVYGTAGPNTFDCSGFTDRKSVV